MNVPLISPPAYVGVVVAVAVGVSVFVAVRVRVSVAEKVAVAVIVEVFLGVVGIVATGLGMGVLDRVGWTVEVNVRVVVMDGSVFVAVTRSTVAVGVGVGIGALWLDEMPKPNGASQPDKTVNGDQDDARVSELGIAEFATEFAAPRAGAGAVAAPPRTPVAKLDVRGTDSLTGLDVVVPRVLGVTGIGRADVAAGVADGFAPTVTVGKVITVTGGVMTRVE